jgi:large subunit ribosomal protein L13
MDSISYKTQFPNKASVEKNWILVDCENEVLGRIASKIAMVLRGKHKPSYAPHVDCGDNVVVINADKVRFTGRKFEDKVYTRHTGFPGGQRFATPKMLKAKSSSIIIESAVRGMLPKNRLGRELFRHLHVYNGSEHPHTAQQPQKIK